MGCALEWPIWGACVTLAPDGPGAPSRRCRWWHPCIVVTVRHDRSSAARWYAGAAARRPRGLGAGGRPGVSTWRAAGEMMSWGGGDADTDGRAAGGGQGHAGCADRRAFRHSPHRDGRAVLSGAEDAYRVGPSRRLSCRRGTSTRRLGRRRHRADDRLGVAVTCSGGRRMAASASARCRVLGDRAVRVARAVSGCQAATPAAPFPGEAAMPQPGGMDDDRGLRHRGGQMRAGPPEAALPGLRPGCAAVGAGPRAYSPRAGRRRG